MSKKESPEINAGSMADIAFLLLIFFLVTTTMDVDSGIFRKIPEKPKENYSIDIKQKNILEVDINYKNEVFVEGNVINLNELKNLAIAFIDNGGGLDKNNNPCDWCQGDKLKNSSDHPTKAVISIKTDRKTSYETYILVLDILNSSYTQLRNELAVKLYNKNYETLLNDYEKTKEKTVEQKINNIREKYPLLLSDAEIN